MGRLKEDNEEESEGGHRTWCQERVGAVSGMAMSSEGGSMEMMFAIELELASA